MVYIKAVLILATYAIAIAGIVVLLGTVTKVAALIIITILALTAASYVKW